MGQREQQFVQDFYERYSGRVAIGVGYAPDMMEIFPFVMKDREGQALGLVAMATLAVDDQPVVHIFHFSVFEQRCGHGSQMLQKLCKQADRSRVTLTLSPIPTENGKDDMISDAALIGWYRKFGFSGESLLCRQPGTRQERSAEFG